MLKQRIITAAVLLAILLPALFWRTPVPFMAVALVLLMAAAWEFARLNQLGQRGAIGCAVVCLALCTASWAAGWVGRSLPLLWMTTGAAWVLAGGWLLRGGVTGWPRIPVAARMVGGVLALWLAWLAVAQARGIGVNFLLSILVLVWVADVFAYFAGRTFGGKLARRKLAPTISPGKTWEGVWGGMAGVTVLAFAWTAADVQFHAAVPSLYSLLASRGAWLLPVAALFLAAMSVVGDLVKSIIKRSVGVKDSSNLLPGHGGVLDRVDALLPTLPLAMMLVSFLKQFP